MNSQWCAASLCILQPNKQQQTCKHTCICTHTCTHTYASTPAHALTYASTPAHALTHTLTHAHTHTHTCICNRTCTCTHTYALAYALTHEAMHIYIYTYIDGSHLYANSGPHVSSVWVDITCHTGMHLLICIMHVCALSS